MARPLSRTHHPWLNPAGRDNPAGVDAQDHWLIIAMAREGDEWTIDDFAAFEGKAPRGGSDEAAEPIDPEGVELVRIQ